MKKTEFVDAIVQHLGVTKAEATRFIDGYAIVATDALKKGGEMTLPNLVKLVLKDTPAKPESQKMNPFTKQMATVKAKPASKKVSAKPLGALKKSVV